MNSNQHSLLLKIIAATAVLTVSGCGPLGPRPAPDADNSVPLFEPRVEYRLPQLEMELQATYQLRACSRQLVDSEVRTEFEVKTAVTVSPRITVLNQPLFSFYPQLVSARNSKADNSVTVSIYPNGTLKSINSKSVDQTGAVFGNVLKLSSSLLKLAFGFPAGAKALDGEVAELCRPGVVKDIKEADSLVARIKHLKKEIKSEALDKLPNDANRKIIAAYEKTIEKLEARLTTLRIESLTFKKTVTIPAEQLTQSTYFGPGELDLSKWMDHASIEYMDSQRRQVWGARDWGDPPDYVSHLVLLSELRFNKAYSPRAVTTKNEKHKIFLRLPVSAVYEICVDTCRTSDGNETDTLRLASGAVQIPQWGQLQAIDFSVDVFEKRTLNMEFDVAGGISVLTWDQPSKAVAASSAFAEIVSGGNTFIDTARYGRERAEIKALDTEIELLNKRIGLDEVQAKYNTYFSTDDTE